MTSDPHDDTNTTDDVSGTSDPSPTAEAGVASAPDDQEPRPGTGFFVVGIGASAGGLAAFEQFFSAMPTDRGTGMAFVIVQHLDPSHKSILTELVARHTSMRVLEVQDGMAVHPDCAYIIPPNRDMAFLNGTLQLLEPSAPRGQRLPIDFFFRSLAQDLHERAIGIVLSGTGSDGTLGIRAIKGEGGMIMAQTPSTTEYDGMPRSAIGTGLVDYELSPAEMPARLISYVRTAVNGPDRSGEVAAGPPENALRKIFVLLRSHTTHDFSQYKISTIKRRIERRMAVQQITSSEEYVRLLQHSPEEVDALFRDLLIGVTNFFRDPAAFKALEERVIAPLVEGKASGGTIRAWCPGCSTGEEAYSIAILISERLATMKRSLKVQIFATDIDRMAIDAARAGFYPESISADVSEERLNRFFTHEIGGGSYRVNKSIRDMLIFSEQDLVKDPPFSRLDLISCRNLLIYMNNDLQKRLIPLFHYALLQKGFLFLGNSENVADYSDLYAVLDRKLKLYQRKEGYLRLPGATHGSSMPAPASPGISVSPGGVKAPPSGKLPWREITEHALLLGATPVAALVNAQGNILYLHGRTGMYLEPAAGDTTVSNILRMAREGLRRDLTTAIHKASLTRERVRCDNVRVKTNGDYTLTNITVNPVAGTVSQGNAGELPGWDATLFLITFEPAPAPLTPEQGSLDANGTGGHGGTDTRVAELQQELKAKEDYLQTTVEELETSNEELKSSNEEMQSVNEELQSTNEELETSKEELQSVNEELATVNAELQTKVTDLSRVNNDMNNLLAGTGFGTVFVDHGLHILRFTPAATRVINLIQGDIGRPVGHLVSNLEGYDSLSEDTRSVLATLIPKEIDVRTRTGVWFTMRIQPYRTLDNVIEGAVITFVEITGMKKSQQEVRESTARFAHLAKTIPLIMTQVDASLRFTWIHDPHQELFSSSVLGRTPSALADNTVIQQLTPIYQRVIQTGSGERTTLRVVTPDGERLYTASVEPLQDEAGAVAGATTTASRTGTTLTQ